MMNEIPKLNCEVGALAITVNAKFSGNIGKVVRVIDSLGMMPWPEIDGLVHVWQVEVAAEGSLLHYFYPNKHQLDVQSTGPIPDCYLRRIVPENNQMRLEFEDCRTREAVEPSAL
jgi:hypothetical protein